MIRNMRSKSARFQPVKQLAEDRAKTATEAMVSARNEHDLNKQKLTELMRYRNDYHAELQSKAKTGMSAIQLQQYQSFIAQLDKAIQQQQHQVSLTKVTLQDRQANWQDKNSHKKAIHNAVGKIEKQEQIAESSREQKELDEHNIQAHFRK